MNDSTTSNKPSSPDLFFRYIDGVGDLVACILHSRFVSPLTRYITGSDTICTSCSKRRQALNILLPLPLWRLWFETREQRTDSLRDEYNRIGIYAQQSDMPQAAPILPPTVTPSISTDVHAPTPISQTESVVGDLRIVVSIYHNG